LRIRSLTFAAPNRRRGQITLQPPVAFLHLSVRELVTIHRLVQFKHGHPHQVCRPAAEFPHRLRVPVRRHGHKVALIAHVNPPGIRMEDRQSGIAGSQPPPQIPALFAVQ
jgi:hypothetical protein